MIMTCYMCLIMRRSQQPVKLLTLHADPPKRCGFRSHLSELTHDGSWLLELNSEYHSGTTDKPHLRPETTSPQHCIESQQTVPDQELWM